MNAVLSGLTALPTRTATFSGAHSISVQAWTRNCGDGFGARGEIRDFYTESPAHNLPGITGGQHNVVAGGGFVLKWGE